MPTFKNSVSGADHAIVGIADKGIGIHGTSSSSTGAGGISESGIGVHGISKTADAVFGSGDKGRGVVGVSGAATGVEGASTSGAGVWGTSENGRGVVGVAKANNAIEGHSTGGAGVFGVSGTGVGIIGKGGLLAARFEGDVEVTGDVRLANADCAEAFDIAEADTVDPGTVMILSEDGLLHQSQGAYDRRVAGIISGAGDYRPGIILDSREAGESRKPIALLGKVFCKVDAGYASVGIGDLLTTSATPGHAMKATDAGKAFGAVIGKALRPLVEGQALIPVLVCLQ